MISPAVVLVGPDPGQVVEDLGNQVASSPGWGSVSSTPFWPARTMSFPGGMYPPGARNQHVVASWRLIVSTLALPPAQGSWIESALVGQ